MLRTCQFPCQFAVSCDSMWLMVCFGVPAEQTAETPRHLWLGRESGSPRRSTHGRKPRASTVSTHPTACRHTPALHLPVRIYGVHIFPDLSSLEFSQETANSYFILPFSSFLLNQLTISVRNQFSISPLRSAQTSPCKNPSSTQGCDYATFSSEITRQQVLETGNFPSD